MKLTWLVELEVYLEKIDIKQMTLETLPIVAVSFYVCKYYIHYINKRNYVHI